MIISKNNILSIFDLDACFLNVPDFQNCILTSLKVYLIITSKSWGCILKAAHSFSQLRKRERWILDSVLCGSISGTSWHWAGGIKKQFWNCHWTVTLNSTSEWCFKCIFIYFLGEGVIYKSNMHMLVLHTGSHSLIYIKISGHWNRQLVKTRHKLDDLSGLKMG